MTEQLEALPVSTEPEPTDPNEAIQIVFSAPPGPGKECVFVETEDARGKGIAVGTWIERADGLWALRIERDDIPTRARQPSNLERHADRELRRAGMFDKDSDYDGMIGEAVMALVRAFCGKGQSGGSAMLTLAAFDQVIRHKPLTPITNDPSEWMQVSPSYTDGQATVWQNIRSSSCFSNDGGKTYYDIDGTDDRAIRQSAEPNGVYANAPVVNEEKSTAVISPLDQPPPKANDARPIWESIIEMCERWVGDNPIDKLVIADMRERDALGRARYGTPLQPNNGRNSTIDAYQELLDAIAYVGNVIVEHAMPLDSMQHELGDMLWRLIAHASTLRAYASNLDEFGNPKPMADAPAT